MPKFPMDAPKTKVIKTLEPLGFRTREQGHVARCGTMQMGLFQEKLGVIISYRPSTYLNQVFKRAAT